MTVLSSFTVTDDVTDNTAARYNKLVAGAGYAEFVNVETLAGTKTLTDADCQFQDLSLGGSDRQVNLPAKAITNHIFYIRHSDGANTMTIKLSGGTTLTTLTTGQIAVCYPSASEDWVISTSITNLSKTGINGLTGINNSGTPNTQYDFAADMVALSNATTSNTVVRTNTGTITCNIALPASGSTSTANGCDQTKISALTSQWVHFYYIWNGTTLATLASLTAPPTGPTLPSGYTHWAYIGAVRLNGSSQLMEVTARGNRFTYNNAASETPIVNDTTDTTEQTASVSTMVPPNALTFNIEAAMTNSAGATKQMLIKYLSGKNLSAPQIANNTILTAVYEMPNVSQQFFWNWNGSSGTSIYITLVSYTIPNGAT